MAEQRHVYGKVDSKADLDRIFREIREEVDRAKDRPHLTELYKRAGYLITLTHAPSWKEKFGKEAASLRKEAEEQFATTARKINAQAKKVGTEADYDEKWGE